MKENILGYAWASILVVGVFSLILTFTNLYAWIVESTGSWAPGRIVSIHHCTSRSVSLSTLALEISYTTADGAQREGEASCEQPPHFIGEAISVRYVPFFPSRIMTREDIGDGHGGWLLLTLAITTGAATLVWWKIANEMAGLRARREARWQNRQQIKVKPRQTTGVRAQRRRARNRR
ncbi:MAG TPA: DUF3592 domain-containing protein [Ktedonobacterales bacterium]